MKLAFISVLTASLLFVGCSGGDDGIDIEKPINIQLTRSEAEAVNAVNDFAFDFLKATEDQVASTNPNYFVSPQGAAWVLSMLANGANPESETIHEIQNGLHLNNGASMQDVNECTSKLIEAITSRNGSADVKVANAFFYKPIYTINPEFTNTLKTFYKIKEFKGPSNSDLDKWISDQTGGMITDFAKKNDFENLNFGLLTNIYFEGKWGKEFDKTLTIPRKFKNSDGNMAFVQMMESHFQPASYYEDDDCRFVKFNFKNGYFSINFIVPANGKEINDILSEMNGNKWRDLIKMTESKEIKIIVPKLELKNEIDLKDMAKSLGIESIFEKGNRDLVKIDTQNPVYVEKFKQANAFSLDEEGAKAASTTVAGMMTGSNLNSPKPITFILNEPFLYFITEESTGAILFTGKVSQL